MTRFLGSLTGMVLAAALLLPAQASAQGPAGVDQGSSVGAPARSAEDTQGRKSLSPADAGDDKETARLLRLKAEQGDAEAQFHLGGLYWLGQGVPKDEKEAVRWFRRAAAQGNAKAQFNLGIASYLGEGTPKNDKEAAHWFRRAAEQGDAQAQYNLGLAYFFGRGVPKNYKEAAHWLRRAADQGDAQAQFNLGLSYAAGAGVPQNYVFAYQWFNLAAAGNDGEVAAKAARERDELASHMTPEQIAKGQRLFRQFRPHSGDKAPAPE
ncbi:MAG: sel1 repeat family protein [Acidobacteriia bacterium]|nr:sel1 repeat family protein [Methyloceanibacter sp.]MBX5471554.1 sel1 repeat family protein [Acetobacteraceae bacterium]MCL6492349.1 sel1 repeat family protein [Terriglobia bacterium]